MDGVSHVGMCTSIIKPLRLFGVAGNSKITGFRFDRITLFLKNSEA